MIRRFGVLFSFALFAANAAGKEKPAFRRQLEEATTPAPRTAKVPASSTIKAGASRHHAARNGKARSAHPSASATAKDGGSKHASSRRKKKAIHPRKPRRVRAVRVDPPGASWRKYRRKPWRRGYVTLVGHGKKWSGYLVDRAGDIPPRARRSVSAVLASWRSGKSMLIDARLLGLVADISDEFGGRPIRIVSGYREFSYAPDSKHKVGQAFDFSIPGVPNEILRDYLKWLPDTGVGYYPNSTHVHLDVRDKPTYWVDYSRPGQRPMYSWERRVAGLTSAERALAQALAAIPIPDLDLNHGNAQALRARGPLLPRGTPAAHAAVADFSMSAVVASPTSERARSRNDATARTDDDDSDDEREPNAVDSGHRRDAASSNGARSTESSNR